MCAQRTVIGNMPVTQLHLQKALTNGYGKNLKATLLWILVVGLLLFYIFLLHQLSNTTSTTAPSSHPSLHKPGQEHGHAYTSLSVMLFLCPECHLLTHYCHSSIPLRHPHSSPPLLHCTQTQRDASCNHCWTQFQGQFEDYLLSSVNKKTEGKHFLDVHLRPIGRLIDGSLRQQLLNMYSLCVCLHSN